MAISRALASSGNGSVLRSVRLSSTYESVPE